MLHFTRISDQLNKLFKNAKEYWALWTLKRTPAQILEEHHSDTVGNQTHSPALGHRNPALPASLSYTYYTAYSPFDCSSYLYYNCCHLSTFADGCRLLLSVLCTRFKPCSGCLLRPAIRRDICPAHFLAQHLSTHLPRVLQLDQSTI